MSKKYISLDRLPERIKGVCYRLDSGRGLKKRLRSMGVFKGVEINDDDWQKQDINDIVDELNFLEF